MKNNQRRTEAISAKLPNFWAAYVIAAIFITVAIVEVIVNPPSAEQEASIILRVIALGGKLFLIYIKSQESHEKIFSILLTNKMLI